MAAPLLAFAACVSGAFPGTPRPEPPRTGSRRPGEAIPTGRDSATNRTAGAAKVLTKFFFTLREAGIPVSLTEHLTLLQALEARVAGYSVDDFYYLARATMVKDEKHFDRFDRVFAAHFKGIEQAFAGLGQEVPAEWLRKLIADTARELDDKAPTP